MSLFDEVVRLFVLKGRPLPQSDDMRSWLEQVERTGVPEDLLAQAVDLLAKDPSQFFTAGDLTSVCRRLKEGREIDRGQEEFKRDPVSEEVGRRFGALYNTLNFGGGINPEESLAMWTAIRGLADEMIDFYADAKKSVEHEARAEWKRTRLQAEAKVVALGG